MSKSRPFSLPRSTKPERTKREVDETIDDYLARGGRITRCPTMPAQDLLAWDTLPERVLGATAEDLENPTSRWHLPSTTRTAIQESQQDALAETDTD